MSLYTSAGSGNWSVAGTWTVTGGSFAAGGPASGDTVVILSAHTVTLDTAAGPSANGIVTVGTSGPGSPTASPTVAATGGGSVTALSGTYLVAYTNIDGSGNESSPSPVSSSLIVTTSSTPLITMAASPAGTTKNLYITLASGTTGSQHLYASGIAAATTTYNPVSASWANGTQTYAASAVMPRSSAIGFDYGTATANGLTLASNTSLTVKGDLMMRGGFGQSNTLTMGSGSTITLSPPSGVQYRLDCSDIAASRPTIAINGLTGSHCTVTTSLTAGGTPGYILTGTVNANQGVMTAAYCDFSNLGTSSAFGVQTHADTPTTTNVSITNCTFMACSLLTLLGKNASWDGNFTFTGNTFASSVANTSSSSDTVQMKANIAASSGTRVLSVNVFDGRVDFIQTYSLNIHHNIFKDQVNCNGTWSSLLVAFDSNLLYHVASTSGIGEIIAGPCTNNYYCLNFPTAVDPIGLGVASLPSGSTVNWTGNIWDVNTSDPTGNPWYANSDAAGPATVNLRYNLVLPNGSSLGGGAFWEDAANMVNLTAVVEHNTGACEQGHAVEIGHFQTLVESPNRYSSIKGNLWWATSGTNSYAIMNVDNGSLVGTATATNGSASVTTTSSQVAALAVGSTVCFGTDATLYTLSGVTSTTLTLSTTYAGTTGGGKTISKRLVDIIPPANADYNASYQMAATSGLFAYTNEGRSYCSRWSATPGAHDIIANPSFVDSTRNFTTWGASVGQGSAGSNYAATVAYVAVDPTNRIPALLAWVRAGFRPTNIAFQAASFPGDPSTADAAGNAWPGGNPGIGAMAWQSAFTPAPIPLFTVGMLGR